MSILGNYDAPKFGSFQSICERAAMVVCPLLETPEGIEPNCYARNVQLGSQLIFQPGESKLRSGVKAQRERWTRDDEAIALFGCRSRVFV